MANEYRPTDVYLKHMVIGANEALDGNFHVKELRVYEDICKYYLTGQLVIEVMQNAWDSLKILPLTNVFLEFETGRNPNPEIRYRQYYKIYSYDSIEIAPKSGGADARLEITINLIGQEFFNDRHNTVMKGIPNQTGTAAVKTLHDQYVNATGASIEVVRPSDGFIGSKNVPYQINNTKPVKAIFDILDTVIAHSEQTASWVYFRNKEKHIVAPLKTLIETALTSQNFQHKPAQGASMNDIFAGHNNIIDFKPMAPPGQVAADASAVFESLLATNIFHDKKTGNTETVKANMSQLNDVLPKDPEARTAIQNMIAEAKKQQYGGASLFSLINDGQKSRSTDKAASGHKQKQEAFLAALGYTKKFWITVPVNSGIEVTCGQNINVTYPKVEDHKFKKPSMKLFVPRLMHQLKFTSTGQQGVRKSLAAVGTTDIFGVKWE